MKLSLKTMSKAKIVTLCLVAIFILITFMITIFQIGQKSRQASLPSAQSIPYVLENSGLKENDGREMEDWIPAQADNKQRSIVSSTKSGKCRVIAYVKEGSSGLKPKKNAMTIPLADNPSTHLQELEVDSSTGTTAYSFFTDFSPLGRQDIKRHLIVNYSCNASQDFSKKEMKQLLSLFKVF